MTQESVKMLSDYIQINTTNPPGNEHKATKFFSEIFDREGIQYKTYESSLNRCSIRAVISGSGEKRPIILLNHIDVVPANKDEFSFDPFGGEIIDGFICGRGALDMKGIGIMQLMAFLSMKRNRIPLKRDLIFLSVADEEEGGKHGMKYLLDNYPDDFNAGLVINEGSYGIADMLNNQQVMLISPSEKGPCWLKLTRKGTPGHGSTPHTDNALEKLNLALSRLLTEELPIIITHTVADYFQRLSEAWEFIAPYAADKKDETLEKILKENGLLAIPQIQAMVKNTISLNMLRAGGKINVIPSHAEALLDIRLLPGQDVDDFVRYVKENLGDDEIIIEKILTARGSESDINNDDFTIIHNTLLKHFSDSLTALYLLSGFSDSRFFRERGIPSYGLCPIFISMEHLKMIHGIDEKISVKNMIMGTEVYTDIVKTLCM